MLQFAAVQEHAVLRVIRGEGEIHNLREGTVRLEDRGEALPVADFDRKGFGAAGIRALLHGDSVGALETTGPPQA